MIFLKTWTSIRNFSNSTGSYVTSSQISPLIALMHLYMRFNPMKQIASIMCTIYMQLQNKKIQDICHVYACKLFLSNKVIEVQHKGSQLLFHN